MSYVNQHNFDWNLTEREIVIFVPNFKRKHLIIPTLERFQTDVPRDEWMFLIVNDGIHEDLSDLAKYNVAYFTLEREPVKERSGCMARNYVIKRLRSRIMASKDPEIIICASDYIKILKQLDDTSMHRAGKAIELQEPDVSKILANPELDVASLTPRREYPIGKSVHEGFHFCYAASVALLREIGGYDEDYEAGYGYEDVDILHRLLRASSETIIDPAVTARHIWHPRRARFLKTVADNGKIFEAKQRVGAVVANQDKEWGEG